MKNKSLSIIFQNKIFVKISNPNQYILILTVKNIKLLRNKGIVRKKLIMNYVDNQKAN